MKCPSCAAECAEGALECASCGVIFAKLEARRRREREEVERALAKLGAESAPVVDPLLGRAVAMAAFTVWAAVMGYFVVQQLRRRPAPRPILPARPERRLRAQRERTWDSHAAHGYEIIAACCRPGRSSCPTA